MKLAGRIADRISGMPVCEQAVFRGRVLLVSDRAAVARRFKSLFGRDPDLNHPKSFNEKILWLLLNYRRPLCSRLSDKFEARAWVADQVGAQYLNALLGIYDRAQDVPWDDLPAAFALKATHGSRWNIICPDKSRLDPAAARRSMNLWMRHNYYWYGREWNYRSLKPRIMGEAFLDGGRGLPPPDFKIYCFNGEPKLIQVDVDRFENHRRNFYDTEWRLLPAAMLYPRCEHTIAPPARLDEMLEIARKLSRTFPFVRVDLYEVGGRVIFGEMTFYPERGLGPFDDDGFNREVGSWIRLPDAHPDRGFWSRLPAVVW